MSRRFEPSESDFKFYFPNRYESAAQAGLMSKTPFSNYGIPIPPGSITTRIGGGASKGKGFFESLFETVNSVVGGAIRGVIGAVEAGTDLGKGAIEGGARTAQASGGFIGGLASLALPFMRSQELRRQQDQERRAMRAALQAQAESDRRKAWLIGAGIATVGVIGLTAILARRRR